MAEEQADQAVQGLFSPEAISNSWKDSFTTDRKC